uniref:Apple domain-containing protein n=1 Tax=Parascaris univalens TaxID=6257 RepID=A0A915AZY1_PARUN
MWFATLITLWFATYATLSEGAKDECIKTYSNLLLTCAKPFESHRSSNVNHCHRLCLANHPRSRSCQYDFFRSRCDLFETQSPLEDFKSASRPSPSNGKRVRRNLFSTCFSTLLF